MPARKNLLALSGTGFTVRRMNFEIPKNRFNIIICVTLMTKEGFLSYYPLKQGLKHDFLKKAKHIDKNFYPTIH